MSLRSAALGAAMSVFLVCAAAAAQPTSPDAALASPASSLAASPDAATASDIFARVERANAARADALVSYTSTRRYVVLEPGHAPDAEMVVTMEYVAPSSKTFTTLNAQGVGWIQRRVFHGLMDAERETAAGQNKHDTAISSSNYDAALVGTDTRDGRDCYVLLLTPKHANKYLFVGKVWVDKEDYGIARVEGAPAKSPSFWIVRAPFVREYQRISGFWLPQRDETHTQIRLAGEYILQIQYADYKVTPRG